MSVKVERSAFICAHGIGEPDAAPDMAACVPDMAAAGADWLELVVPEELHAATTATPLTLRAAVAQRRADGLVRLGAFIITPCFPTRRSLKPFGLTGPSGTPGVGGTGRDQPPQARNRKLPSSHQRQPADSVDSCGPGAALC